MQHVTIWGNHSATQYPDAYHATIDGEPAAAVIDDDVWIRKSFIPTVPERGAAIIEAHGQSSAARAANAAINHVQTWYSGTPAGDWVSMAIPSTGAVWLARRGGLSYPVTVNNGIVSVVEGLELSDFDKEMIAATGQELLEERDSVAEMLG